MASGKKTAAPRGDKNHYVYKLYRVKGSSGKVTTVSLNPDLALRAIRHYGSDAQVGELVRAAAAEWNGSPQTTPRSRFVAKRLMDALARDMLRRGQAA